MPSVDHHLQAATRQLALRAAFGKRLKAMRAAAGLSVDELHERTGLAAQSITRAERGHANPSLSMLDSLAGALGVAPGRLIDDLVPRDEGQQGDRAS